MSPNKTISFFAPGIPVGQPRAKSQIRRFGDKTFAHTYTPGTAENFKSCIAAAAKPHLPKSPILGPVQVDCTFYLPRLLAHYGSGKNTGQLRGSAPQFHIVKPDLDNALKVVFDTLTYLRFWVDDKQICKTWSEKRYEDVSTKCGVQIVITELDNHADGSDSRRVFGDFRTEKQPVLEALL